MLRRGPERELQSAGGVPPLAGQEERTQRLHRTVRCGSTTGASARSALGDDSCAEDTPVCAAGRTAATDARREFTAADVGAGANRTDARYRLLPVGTRCMPRPGPGEAAPRTDKACAAPLSTGTCLSPRPRRSLRPCTQEATFGNWLDREDRHGPRRLGNCCTLAGSPQHGGTLASGWRNLRMVANRQTRRVAVGGLGTVGFEVARRIRRRRDRRPDPFGGVGAGPRAGAGTDARISLTRGRRRCRRARRGRGHRGRECAGRGVSRDCGAGGPSRKGPRHHQRRGAARPRRPRRHRARHRCANRGAERCGDGARRGARRGRERHRVGHHDHPQAARAVSLAHRISSRRASKWTGSTRR